MSELIKKAYADSELSGKCYEAAVKYVEALEKIQVDQHEYELYDNARIKCLNKAEEFGG